MQSIPTPSWTEVLTGIDPSDRVGVLIVAISCTVGLILGLVGIVMSTVGSIQRRRAEMDLKREMIERGMSADEIATVIQAAAPKNASRCG